MAEVSRSIYNSRTYSNIFQYSLLSFSWLTPERLIFVFLFLQPVFEFSNVPELNVVRHIAWRLLIVFIFSFTLYEAIRSNKSFSLKGFIKYPLMIYVLTAFLSTSLAVMKSEMEMLFAAYALITLLLLLLFIYVIPYWFDSLNKILKVINIYLLSLTITNLYGVSEFIINRFLLGDIFFRMSSFFNDPNIYSRFNLIGIFFILSLLFFHKGLNKSQILVYASILSIAIISLFLSLSRSGYLTFFIGLIIFSFFLEGKRYKVIAFLSVFLMAIIAIILLATQRDFFGGTALVEASTLNRVQLIIGGINFLQDNWLFGVGYTNFGNFYISHYVSKILKVSAFDYTMTGFATSIHNWFIEVWVEQGIFGIIAFFILFSNLLRNLFRRFKLTENQSLKACLLSFFFMILIFLTHGFFYHTFMFHFFFWLMLGFAVAALNIANRHLGYDE